MPQNDTGNPQLDGALAALQEMGKYWLRTYHRHQVIAETTEPDEPAIIIGNHGYGGIFDLNIMAVWPALERAGFVRPFVPMVHEAAWQIPGVQQIVELNGGVKGSPENVRRVLGEGKHVVIFPGGDIDSGKPFARRNTISFSGRFGFARVAMENDAPIVPLITAGAGEGGFVITDGRTLAKVTGLKKNMNHTTLPVGVGVLGPHVSLLGFQLPYFPLPTRLQSVVMAPMRPEEGEEAADFAVRVEQAMQGRMDRLVRGRIPILGTKLPFRR